MAGTAIPGSEAAAHPKPEASQMRDRIDHGPPFALLLNQPVQKLIHFLPFRVRDAQHIVLVAIMARVHERAGRLIQMVVCAEAVLVGDLRQHANILQIVPANVDVEEDKVSIFFLSLHKVPELRFNVEEHLGQSPSGSDTVYGEIDCRNSRLPDFIDEKLVQQIAVCREVHEKTVLRAIPHHFENEVFAKKGFPPPLEE